MTNKSILISLIIHLYTSKAFFFFMYKITNCLRSVFSLKRMNSLSVKATMSKIFAFFNLEGHSFLTFFSPWTEIFIFCSLRSKHNVLGEVHILDKVWLQKNKQIFLSNGKESMSNMSDINYLQWWLVPFNQANLTNAYICLHKSVLLFWSIY